MKLIDILIIFCLLGMSFAAAEDTGAPTAYPIYGIITLDGVRAEAMQVSLTNLKTGQVLIKPTIGGEFVYDLTDFSPYGSTGSQYKFTYCISDSRCDETSITFTPSGMGYDLSKNLPYGGTPLTGPYDVYGLVFKDGQIQEKVDVTIENVNKGFSKTIKTNSNGEYIWNLAEWGKYDTGDQIRVTSVGKTIIGYVSGAGLKLNVEYITPTEPTTPPSDDGDGSGPHDYENQDDIIHPEEETIEPVEPIEPGEEEEEEVIVEPKPVEPSSKGAKIFGAILLAIIALLIVYYFVFKKK